MFQVSTLKETFPESYYLENKMLLWPSVHFPCVNSSVLTARYGTLYLMLFVVSFYWLLPSTSLAIQLNPAIHFTQLKCLLQKIYYGTFDLNVLSLLNCLNVSVIIYLCFQILT